MSVVTTERLVVRDWTDSHAGPYGTWAVEVRDTAVVVGAELETFVRQNPDGA
ncbi:hypothetical protein [Micromonospora yangpuensis]|uniref:Uncharacterized protein n=1 Tax=Micromonospora yangpuensis TaxID=683228 RepID=A0A1C6UCE3_9ACTN|nr:hypothetical protein [Micromonospora yangpuensis]GGL86401.1 hypothetical protein GCM10012279_00080 [Micromonospora yangpuensis]SCL51529.1 hypothetical protein GA0070617_1806 [Micromonospora yangpuensis]